MAEYKFRAWDKKRNEWYGASCPESLTFIDFSIFGECTLLCTPSVEDLMHLEINQKTGLKDINGADIYISDIVRFDVMAGYVQGEVYQVADGLYCVSGHVLFGRLETTEIIGNIYENPELMK